MGGGKGPNPAPSPRHWGDVPPFSRGLAFPAVYRRILVGTDGSATAAKAVDRAVAVAAATAASLTILSVGAAGNATPVVEREAARHAGSGVKIATETRAGDAASVIIDVAEAGGYELLVVGNKGMTGASRVFLGSVPNKVSHHAPVALLILRTTGGALPRGSLR